MIVIDGSLCYVGDYCDSIEFFYSLIIIIIWYSIDPGDVHATSTTFSESHHISLRPLQITITLTEGALLIFLQSWFEKLLAWLRIWAYDLKS